MGAVTPHSKIVFRIRLSEYPSLICSQCYGYGFDTNKFTRPICKHCDRSGVELIPWAELFKAGRKLTT